MKERIEEKLEKNIERILDKDELLPTDVAILKEKLNDIEREESKEQNEIRKKEMINLLTEGGFSG